MKPVPTHAPHHDGPETVFPDVNEKGAVVHRSQANIAAAMSRLGIGVYFDEFANRLMICRGDSVGELNDTALNKLFFDCDALGLKPPKPWFVDCIMNMAHGDRRNSVRDELLATSWDGKPRLDGWLVRYAEGDNTPFARAAFKHQMMAGAARILTPGCKFDQILVLEGPQGGGKSTFVMILAGPGLHTDALTVGASDKETLEVAHGKRIVELGELVGIGRRELAAVKAFASRQSDRARPAYARTAVEVPRQFTIWGTTNDSEYLEDPTGNRRFWPVRVGRFNLKQAEADRAQLWAEAVHLVRTGHSLVLPDSLWSAAAQVQSERVVGDTWEELIQQKLTPFQGQPIKLSTYSLLKAIGVEGPKQDKQAQMRVGRIMKRLGFTSTLLGKDRLRAWLRGEAAGAIRLECLAVNGDVCRGGEA
jgi:predicted P-loop ATPase